MLYAATLVAVAAGVGLWEMLVRAAGKRLGGWGRVIGGVLFATLVSRLVMNAFDQPGELALAMVVGYFAATFRRFTSGKDGDRQAEIDLTDA